MTFCNNTHLPEDVNELILLVSNLIHAIKTIHSFVLNRKAARETKRMCAGLCLGRWGVHYLSLPLSPGKLHLFQHLRPLLHHQRLLISEGWDVIIMLRRRGQKHTHQHNMEQQETSHKTSANTAETLQQFVYFVCFSGLSYISWIKLKNYVPHTIEISKCIHWSYV